MTKPISSRWYGQDIDELERNRVQRERKKEEAVLTPVLKLKRKYSGTWRSEPESYWFARVVQEIGELGSSLVGDHDDSPEHELTQLAAMILNWLEMRHGTQSD